MSFNIIKIKPPSKKRNNTEKTQVYGSCIGLAVLVLKITCVHFGLLLFPGRKIMLYRILSVGLCCCKGEEHNNYV